MEGRTDEYIDPMFARLFDRGFLLPQLPALARIASRCEICRSWPAQPVCGPCMARFAPQLPRCHGCAIALPADLSMGLRSAAELCADCVRQRPPLDQAFAAVAYAYPWSGLVSRYKFEDQPGWAAVFAAMLLDTSGVREALANLQSGDWVVPMQLSAQRLQARGFNQARQLATALARQSGSAARTDARLLLRVKNTRPQSQLERADRLTNVKGAFLVDPLRCAELDGRHVVLVDDVMTSGASIFTAATALCEAGAETVTALVFARTE